MSTSLTAIGLMSGTSLDGVDVALIVTDGVRVQHLGPSRTFAYDQDFKRHLRSVLGGVGPVKAVERELTLIHARVVEAFIRDHDLDPAGIDVVGFHGHTIMHRPERRMTWQIGDGAMLASLIGRPVVADFRSADVAAGGQGAPLVPVYHQALAADLEPPLMIVNIGGVANVTWIGRESGLLAFDSGPGNALIDDWVLRHTGRGYDEGGALAGQGRADSEKVDAFMAHEFFGKPPPKSLDRDQFAALADDLTARMSLADGAATLTAFTVSSLEAAQRHCPDRPQRWLVTGGGRHNAALMASLRNALSVPVEPVEVVGWNGDALEAQAFGFLAVRSLRGLPLTFPETTRVDRPLTGGVLFKPEIPK